MQFTLDAEECLGSPAAALEVDSISDDSSDSSQLEDSEYDVLTPSDDGLDAEADIKRKEHHLAFKLESKF